MIPASFCSIPANRALTWRGLALIMAVFKEERKMKRSEIIGIMRRDGDSESLSGVRVSFETHKDYLTKGPIARRNVMRALRNALVDYADVERVAFRDGCGRVEEAEAY